MTKYQPVRQHVQNIIPFGLRMQPDLRTMIEKATAASGRSINAEICIRLQQSFTSDAGKIDELLMLTKEVLETVHSLKTTRNKK